MCEVFTISLCYTFIVRYEQYSSTTHNIPAVSTLYYCIHNSVYERRIILLIEMGLQGKKFAAQKIIGKYLWIRGGDFYTPLS